MADDTVRQALADLSRCASVYLYFVDTGDGDVDKAHDDLIESLEVADQLLAGERIGEPAVSLRRHVRRHPGRRR